MEHEGILVANTEAGSRPGYIDRVVRSDCDSVPCLAIFAIKLLVEDQGAVRRELDNQRGNICSTTHCLDGAHHNNRPVRSCRHSAERIYAFASRIGALPHEAACGCDFDHHYVEIADLITGSGACSVNAAVRCDGDSVASAPSETLCQTRLPAESNLTTN